MTRETILIIDFGASTTQLIARQIRQSHVYCEIIPASVSEDKIQNFQPKGLVFSDMKPYGMSKNKADWQKIASNFNIPVLTIGESQKLLPDDFANSFSCEFSAKSNEWKGIVEAFLQKCHCSRNWTMEAFAEATIRELRGKIGGERVICGLSGGVDSAVVAALLSKAVGEQLHCIFVDTGLMRKGEIDAVAAEFSNHFKTNLMVVKAESRFLKELAGVTEPQTKRKKIGHLFIDVFSDEASKIQGARFLAQGTVYPDILESGGTSDTPAATIKLHHNVGGLPDDLEFDLVEPLRDLFKDEVRQLGSYLGLPDEIVWRHPFPGPGLAVRCLGEVTKERLDVLREADAIVVDEIKKAGLYRETSQGFAILLPVQSVGVTDEGRTYESAVVIRCIVTDDFMHADWVRLPYHLLATISERVIKEVNGVNRVVYDISTKPPATIEWE
ncbi:MAG: glutamine-hydrolyzing GMP synthase [Planctomycetaceae bacterium]|nr:glutamine-hydrolyzing GMP synthase [Planctomycetaceae bacterium]